MSFYLNFRAQTVGGGVIDRTCSKVMARQRRWHCEQWDLHSSQWCLAERTSFLLCTDTPLLSPTLLQFPCSPRALMLKLAVPIGDTIGERWHSHGNLLPKQ